MYIIIIIIIIIVQVSALPGLRGGEFTLTGALASFLAKYAMSFTSALACIPRKDRVRNRSDRPAFNKW